MRVPRRAVRKDGTVIKAMSLGNMRDHGGVRRIRAYCGATGCGRSWVVDVNGWHDHILVPDVALQLRCDCGSWRIETRPDWQDHRAAGKSMDLP